MSQIKPILEICQKCPQFSIKKATQWDDIFDHNSGSAVPYIHDSLDMHVFAGPPERNDETVCALMSEDTYGFGIKFSDGTIIFHEGAAIPNDCDFKLEYIMKKDADAAAKRSL